MTGAVSNSEQEIAALRAIPVTPIPEALPTPALFLDIEILRANIVRMQKFVDAEGVSLRPHMKTHKSTKIGAVQVESGAGGITVGTLHEAEVFANAGFDDIFLAVVAYASGDKASRVRKLHEDVLFRVGIDSAAGAQSLANATAASAHPLEVLIEIDCGEHRTGVLPGQVVELALAAHKAGLAVVGIFTHGGHAYAGREARRPAAQDELDALERAASALLSAGFEVRIISAGSTPTVGYSSRGFVTEQRPGTYALNDAGQVALGTCGANDVALRVAATIISDSVPAQVIIDAGTKAIAREPASYLPGLGWIPDLRGSVVWTVNDYHGFVRVDSASSAVVGTRLSVVPNHVCPVVNLYDEMHIVQNGAVIDVWEIDARGN